MVEHGVLSMLLLIGSSGSGAAAAPAWSAPAALLQGPAATEPGALLPVDLPDLGEMAASVQEQFRAAEARFQQATANPSARRADLAAAYGEMGKLLMAAEAFAYAQPYFLNARRLAPQEARWTYYLAQLARFQGRSTEASEYFEEVLAIEPDNAAALVWLGDVYLDRGLAGRAEPLFARAAAAQPDMFAAQFGLGRAALARGDHDAAVEHLERARSLNPRASAVHYPLALAYRGLGRLAEAERHLRARGDLNMGPPDPLMEEIAALLDSATVHEGRGDRALARGDFAAAVTAFQQAAALAPGETALAQKLATALALSGDVPAAVRRYEAILRDDPDFAEARFSLGVLLAGSGRPDLAIQQYAEAVRADPAYLQARLQLAHLLRRTGQAGAAIEHYQRALEIDSRVAEARFGYAVALAALERYQEAIDVLELGARVHDRPEFLDTLARLLAAAPDAAVRDGARALAVAAQLRERFPAADARETMAMALAEAGRFEEARTWQREAIAAAERTGQRDRIPSLTAALHDYEEERPSRTPWHGEPAWGR